MYAMICDMDGSLCDVEPIRHYVSGDRRDFRAFHEASRFMSPRPIVDAMVRNAHNLGLAVVIVTARDARFERATRDFLVRHGLPFDALFMRPWGDLRRDTEVKRDIYSDILMAGFTPVHAIDDRADIAEVWESFGVPTTLVAEASSPGVR